MRCKIIYLFAIISLLAVGCNEQDDGGHVEPITIYEKMNGQWGLMNLKMVDEFAKTNAIEPAEQNLSTLFNFEDFKISFNVDDKMQPTSYKVLGDVPPLFAPNGYWELNQPFQQTNGGAAIIYLYNDAQKTQLTDQLRLTSVPGSNEEMEIQLTRVSGGTAFVSYVFKLSAIN